MKYGVMMLWAWGLATAVLHAEDWRERLQHELPVLGHRNWVVVADSAYPAQIAPGITTIYVGGEHLAAVRETLKLVSAQKHVHPLVWTDDELAHVPNADAPGIESFRGELQRTLKGYDVQHRPHLQIIQKLDGAAQTFRVLVLKTDGALPYTSIFIELDCGYWNASAEERLRAQMKVEKAP